MINSNLHKRRSIRLKDYDYSQSGEYFITICTHNHECLFGEVVDEGIKLSPQGKTAQQCWLDIPMHFNNAELDEYVIMPNHIHGIIILKDNSVGTRHAVSLHEQFGKPKCGTIPTIVRSFKSAATRQIRILTNEYEIPIWQSRFYEHIIRDDKDLDNVREYITNNPFNWLLEKDVPNNLLGTLT
jgi:putative transposase